MDEWMDEWMDDFPTGGYQVHRYRSDLTEPEDKNDKKIDG